MNVRRRRFAGIPTLTVLSLAVIGVAGCASDAGRGPVVFEMKGTKVGLEDLRLQYERANGPGSFAKVSPEKKQEFLKTVADKDVLLAISRERTEGVTAEEEKALRASDDQRLLKGLERSVLAPVHADSALTRQMAEKLQRQILVDWLVTPSDSLTRVARAEIAAGRPFADVARRYSTADPKMVPDGHVDWSTGTQFGRDYVKELFIEDRPAGYLSEIRRTPRGFELFQVRDYRPYTPPPGGRDANFPQAMAEDIRNYDRYVAWSDSLKKARNLELHGDAVAALRAGMASYWDSLKAYVQQTQKRPSRFVPPIHRFDAGQLNMPLYRFDGKETTIRQFLDSLTSLTVKMWPNDPDPVIFAGQVESLALMQLEVVVAREKGIDRDPGYLVECGMDRERILLTKLQNLVSKDLPSPTDEEIKAYYESHLDAFRVRDQMLLSYLTFPSLPEAQRFYTEAMKHDGPWWTGQCFEYQNKHPEVSVVSNSPPIDPNDPPSDIAPIVARARNMKVSEIIEPIRTEKGWAVARIAMNQHEEQQPLEKADASIRRILTESRVAVAMEKMIDEGRKRFAAKMYPERLSPKT